MTRIVFDPTNPADTEVTRAMLLGWNAWEEPEPVVVEAVIQQQQEEITR